MIVSEAWMWVDNNIMSHPKYNKIGAPSTAHTFHIRGEFLAGAWRRYSGEPRESMTGMYQVSGWDVAEEILNPKVRRWKITRGETGISYMDGDEEIRYDPSVMEVVIESVAKPESQTAYVCEVIDG